MLRVPRMLGWAVAKLETHRLLWSPRFCDAGDAEQGGACT